MTKTRVLEPLDPAQRSVNDEVSRLAVERHRLIPDLTD